MMTVDCQNGTHSPVALWYADAMSYYIIYLLLILNSYIELFNQALKRVYIAKEIKLSV